MRGLSMCEAGLDLLHQFFNGRAFDEVVVDVLPHGFESGLEGGISGQNEGQGIGMSSAHGADDNETVRGMSYVEIGNQYIKVGLRDLGQSLANGACRGYDEAFGLENETEHGPNIFFIVDDQDCRAGVHV